MCGSTKAANEVFDQDLAVLGGFSGSCALEKVRYHVGLGWFLMKGHPNREGRVAQFGVNGFWKKGFGSANLR